MGRTRTRRVIRLARGLGVLVAGLVFLLAGTLAVPIPVWRTGELPVPPLPLVAGGPAVHLPARLWIDTDAACGHSRTTDPDDCLALLLLAQAPAVEIVGISTVHGNAPLDVTDHTTRALVAALERAGATAPPVYRGAARPAGTAGAGGVPAPAHAALQQALEHGPLTVVSLGPLTNVAAALRDRPDLQAQVARLVAVMGRRRGHLFHPTEGAGSGILFGHGPVFRDFNVAHDPHAAAAVLGMRVPLTLIPYEAARDVSLTGSDLARLEEAAGGAVAWVASRAQGWLDFWATVVGRRGFYPFDLLAGAYVLAPHLFACAEAAAWVGEDDTLWAWVSQAPALLVGTVQERPAAGHPGHTVIYCPQIAATMHQRLVSWLTAPGQDRTQKGAR
jgi:inosine-uridine nucleoside N-ribohydrolase